MGSGRLRRWTWVAFVAYLALVARMTLRPEPADEETFDVVRAVIGWLAARGAPVTYDGVEAVSNVLMFVPFGVLAGLLVARGRWWVVLAAGCATSVAIETAQRLFLPTRVPTAQDVVLNTAGTAVGLVLLAAGLRWWSARAARSASTTAGTRAPVGASGADAG
ncbi:VanZ family protein [Cellulomonas sp. P22]|uniref:VanZ family protein n=1 Tax=Cellulomonas sp. P22 TaxID=3373189 RepID=UPI00379F11DF